MTAPVRPWYACTGDPCTCPKPLPSGPMAIDPLRAEVARIAATCEAIASMPTDADSIGAARCLQGVANSLRSALEKCK